VRVCCKKRQQNYRSWHQSNDPWVPSKMISWRLVSIPSLAASDQIIIPFTPPSFLFFINHEGAGVGSRVRPSPSTSLAIKLSSSSSPCDTHLRAACKPRTPVRATLLIRLLDARASVELRRAGETAEPIGSAIEE
jgi:hypothetical protein